jgi:DNA-binding response OmpR family regulator
VTIARLIQRALRCDAPTERGVLSADGVTFDVGRRRALVDGYVIHVPPGEANLLALLMRRAGRPVDRCALVQVLRPDLADVDAVLDRLTRRLRWRLQPSPLSVPRIHATATGDYLFGHRLAEVVAPR